MLFRSKSSTIEENEKGVRVATLKAYMKEKLYTIPLNDAMNADDECPFCYIERSLEQDLLDFTLGSGASYMEGDIREETDKAGFCRPHFKKMFDYGNTLGNAWILKTHYKRMIQEMEKEFKSFSPSKQSFKAKMKKNADSGNSVGVWVAQKEKSCYICKQYEETYTRYLDTFFVMYHRDSEFREKVKMSKGFCLPHFRDLLEQADIQLNDKEKADFYPMMFHLMDENMNRISEDVNWLVEKFDYRYKDADWKNSKDAVQRGMQKLKGGYPADPAYQMNR